MVLHLPGVVDAQPVGELHLGQRVLEEPELGAVLPGPRQLVLVEDPELHRTLLSCSPGMLSPPIMHDLVIEDARIVDGAPSVQVPRRLHWERPKATPRRSCSSPHRFWYPFGDT